MPKRNRRRFITGKRIAIVGLTGTLLILAFGIFRAPQPIDPLDASQAERQSESERASSGSRSVTCHANCQVTFGPRRIDQGDEGESTNQEPEPGNYTSNGISLADYSQQRIMAHWTTVIAGLTAWGALLLVGTLYEAFVGTEAAGKAVDAQVDAERPIVQVDKLSLVCDEKASSAGDELLFYFEWTLTNFGKTGCWLRRIAMGRQVCEFLPDERPETKGDIYSAFLSPGRGISQSRTMTPNFVLGAADSKIIRAKIPIPLPIGKAVHIIGFAEYAGIGGRVWRSHFGVRMNLDGKFNSTGWNPVQSRTYWEDLEIEPDEQS